MLADFFFSENPACVAIELVEVSDCHSKVALNGSRSSRLSSVLCNSYMPPAREHVTGVQRKRRNDS